jgi:hypothetical protein
MAGADDRWHSDRTCHDLTVVDRLGFALRATEDTVDSALLIKAAIMGGKAQVIVAESE